MELKFYAQLDAAGNVVGVSQLAGEVVSPDLVELQSYDLGKLGQVFDRQARTFGPRVKTVKEQAAEDLQAIDASTGMSRTLREVLISIGQKTGADVAFLAAKEAAAAAARDKLK